MNNSTCLMEVRRREISLVFVFVLIQILCSCLFSTIPNQPRLSRWHTDKREMREFVLLAGRTWKNIVRNPETSHVSIISSLIVSLLVIGVFWQVDEDPTTGFVDRTGLVFFIMIFQIISTMTSMEGTVKERVVVTHETSSGFYRMYVYVLVNIVVGIIPLRLAVLIPSCTIMYYGIGFRNSFDAYLLFLLTMFILTMAISALSFFMISVFETFSASQIVATVVLLLMMLFSGVIVNLKNAVDWISWMKYVSFINYGSAALYSNEFKDRVMCFPDSNGTMCKEGNQYLSDIKVDYKTSWDFWCNHLALTVLATLLFSLTYVQLMRRRMNS